MSILLSSITNTGQIDLISRSLVWSNMVKCSAQDSADCFCTDLCGDHSMKAATTAQVTAQDIGRLLQAESLLLLYINPLFPIMKELFCTNMASQTAAEMVSSPVSMHPNTCYQTFLNGLTAHNCHSHLYTTHY